MGAIFEDVEERHGGGGEAVDEEGLELPFEKVQSDEDQGERLEGGGRGQAGVEQWVDDEGADVLDEKDGAPWDLDTCDFSRERSQMEGDGPAGRGRTRGGEWGVGSGERGIYPSL